MRHATIANMSVDFFKILQSSLTGNKDSIFHSSLWLYYNTNKKILRTLQNTARPRERAKLTTAAMPKRGPKWKASRLSKWKLTKIRGPHAGYIFVRLFLYIGAPFGGCPENKSLTIRVLYSAP